MLIGPGHAGKTVFLTLLYFYGGGQPVEGQPKDVTVSIRKGEEILIGKYLRRLMLGRWPDATKPEEYAEISLVLAGSQQMFRGRVERRKTRVLVIPEFAGQLLTDPTTGTGIAYKLRNNQPLNADEMKIVSFIEDCEAYIFILDPQLPEAIEKPTADTPSDRWLLQQDYISLARKIADDGFNRKPLCLLATKWDTVQKANGETGPEEYVRGRFGHSVTQFEQFWRKDKISFLRVGLETDIQGNPSVPISPVGYDEILNWLFKSL